jgi:hypothetical protein
MKIEMSQIQEARDAALAKSAELSEKLAQTFAELQSKVGQIENHNLTVDQRNNQLQAEINLIKEGSIFFDCLFF